MNAFLSTHGWCLHPDGTRGVTLHSKQILQTCWISMSRPRTSETKFSVSAYRYAWNCSRYSKKLCWCAFPPLHDPRIKFPWAPRRAQASRLIPRIVAAFLAHHHLPGQKWIQQHKKLIILQEAWLLRSLKWQRNNLHARVAGAGGSAPTSAPRSCRRSLSTQTASSVFWGSDCYTELKFDNDYTSI